MKLLTAIHEKDFFPDSPKLDGSDYKKREAARAVLLDKDRKVFLLNITAHGYHKLPGGGIDPGENIKEALDRELMEEVGCEAEIISEIGQVVEQRDFEKQNQTSYCFLAKQVGEKQANSLEESEIDEGMVEDMARNIDDAITMLENDEPDNIEGQFIKKRDLTFLNRAKEVLNETL